MRTFPPLGQDKRVLAFACSWLTIAHRRACRGCRAASHISIPYMLLCHGQTLGHDHVLLLVNSRGWGRLAPLYGILDVAVDDDVLSFGYPSSEGGPIGSPTMSRPCTRDGVNTFG